MADLASMVIGLRADVAQLQSDLGKATDLNRRYAQQAAQAWNSAGSAVADSLRDIAGKVAAAFAIDKLVEFGKQAIDTADQLGKMAQKVGVSVESLSALSTQAKFSGVATDELQAGLAKLAKNAADAAGGSKESAAAFSAMGLSVKDSNGNLKSTQQLLQDVSAKFAGYEDGASKTALAQRLFGKSGAELIPILNELGEKGFKAVTDQAEKYGQVISGDTARQANEFNDNLTKLTMAATGFANAVARDALPDLVRLTDEMAEGASTSDAYEGSAKRVANAVVVVAENVAELVRDLSDLPSEISKSADEFESWANSLGLTNRQLQTLIDLIPKVPKPTTGGGLVDISIIPDSPIDKFLKFVNTPTLGSALSDKSDIAKLAPQITSLDGALKIVVGDVNAASEGFGGLAQHVDASAVSAGKAKAPIVDLGKSTADSLQRAEDQAARFLASIDGIGADKYTKAVSDYNAKLAEMDKVFNQLVLSGASAADAINFAAEASAKLASAQADVVQGIRNSNDVDAILAKNVADATSQMNEQIRVLGLDSEAAKEAALANRLITAALGDMKDFMGPLTEAQQSEIDKLKAIAHETVTTDKAIEDSKAVWQGWSNIIQGAASSVSDAFAKALVEGGSLLKSLADVAKQVVEQIISYFLKLAIINPILNSIFGGVFGAAGGSLLPTFASAVGSAFGGSGEVGVSGGTTTGGGSFDLFTAGKTIWNGFQNGYQSFFQGDSAFTMGPPTEAGSTSSYYGGGYSSGFGQALGIAGGVYAGYNEFNRAGGGVAGVAGGAAYGYGTYALGAGIATLATTGSLTAAFAAIPVVGWIAIAAMLIDKFSGGKLFGTKGTVQGGSTALNIDATGANYTTGISLKGQKALFGGAKWSWQDIPETPEQAAAAQAFFDSMTKTMKQYAGQFGVKAGDLVAATFEQEFDKKGNPTGVTHATIAGYKYENLTGDQFSQAYLAANQLTVLDQFDSKLESTIAEFRKSADTLVQIANGLTEAEGYLQSGGDLLAIAGKDTLSSIVTLASGMQQAGETIDQTIDRLIKAQVQYDQFVAQFKPAAHYVDDFEQTLSGINQQMLANIKQANALAQAAGAAGASEQDLANIHKYAAQQAAQAIAALEASAQSLAFSLGLTTVGSLDEVNSEIAALQAKANQGGSAVRNFGSAMTDAAQAAKNAMDLLLGDLSPLNDQQKLQKALAGLRQGSVSQEQVLEIGRRLYASTAQYTSLFNMVMQMGPGTHASSVGGGIAGGNQGGLSGAERDRLNTLLKEQQQLQATAQLQQYRTLAQQIAEIASAKGEDWRQVLKDMGINIADFEKGLNLNDKQTSDYIDAIQKQTDDFGDNATSLIAALNALTVALGGTPPADDGSGSSNSDGSPPRTPPGHSGHSRSYQDGRDLARGFRDALNDVLPRGGRQQTARGTARVG